MNMILKATAIAAAAASLATAAPALALPAYAPSGVTHVSPGQEVYEHNRKRNNRNEYRRGYRDARSDYTRSWRGRDGRYYCKKNDGTTGLLIGGAAGALLGRAIDTRGDRAVGTIAGAAGGALVGRSIDRNSSCR